MQRILNKSKWFRFVFTNNPNDNWWEEAYNNNYNVQARYRMKMRDTCRNHTRNRKTKNN